MLKEGLVALGKRGAVQRHDTAAHGSSFVRPLQESGALECGDGEARAPHAQSMSSRTHVPTTSRCRLGPRSRR